jgi:dihydroorotase-like cyclic amidohydrolase
MFLVIILCCYPYRVTNASAHVHLNEPGRTDWEGFDTGTKAAVAGGFTAVVDMPLNSIPPTTTTDNLELKRQAARGQCWSDVAFWGGVIPHNQVESHSPHARLRASNSLMVIYIRTIFNPWFILA